MHGNNVISNSQMLCKPILFLANSGKGKAMTDKLIVNIIFLNQFSASKRTVLVAGQSLRRRLN